MEGKTLIRLIYTEGELFVDSGDEKDWAAALSDLDGQLLLDAGGFVLEVINHYLQKKNEVLARHKKGICPERSPILREMIKKESDLRSNSVDVPTDVVDMVNKNFWDLI